MKGDSMLFLVDVSDKCMCANVVCDELSCGVHW